MKRIAFVALVVLAGCSEKKEPEKTAAVPAVQTLASPATPASPSAAPAAKPMNPNDPAAAMQAMLGAAGNDPNAKAVNWRDLGAVLADDVAGWRADKPVAGESTAMGAFTVSEARREYKKDAVTAHVKVTDTSMNKMLASAFNLARMANVDASDHYTRGVDVGGNPGVEEWHQGAKNGKVAALVGGRFIVEVNASNVADTKALLELATKLDLAKLASLK